MRENLVKLLKNNIEKMSVFRLAIMFMKTNWLFIFAIMFMKMKE